MRIRTNLTNPYVLDLAEDGVDSVAALSDKNRNFLEAVVMLDSNYKRDSQCVPPDAGFNLENNASDSEGKYCGSLTFWFSEMQKTPSTFTYEECILGAVISIDRSNSTHLEQVTDGRKRMRDRITRCCPDLVSLKEALAVPFSANNSNHLICKMTEAGMKSIKNETDVFFISFASKFCAYAAIALNVKDSEGKSIEYSKYDNVVSDHLNVYAKLYLDLPKKPTKSSYKISQITDNYSLKREKGLGVYQRYQETIGAILQRLLQDGILMNRSELDHIIWYCEKGN